MSLPALDLRDPVLAAAVADRSLVVSASAGSGKTFALVTLVLGFLGRDGRAPAVVATTFGREAAADLRGRLLLPLDQLAGWTEVDWGEALAALGEGFEGWDAWLADRTLPVRAEIAGAARSWQAGGLPEWMGSPVRARAHWIRVRREAELLRATTVHALALSVLRRRGRREGTLLAAEDPRLLGLLRAAGRDLLDLPATDPDAPAARRLWAWCEGFEEGRDRWSALASAFDAHQDALGGWRTASDTGPYREAFEAEGRRVLAAYAPYVARPLEAALVTKSGKPHANFIKLGLSKFQGEPGGDEEALLEALERLASRFLKADGRGFPNYYAETFQDALAPLLEEAPAALEGWMTLLLERVFQRFRDLKAERGLQSHGDLVREALALLRERPEPAPPALLLVDEYQDVNPVQEAFLAALGAARTVVVGDPKQAIYGFRGGVPELLQARLRAAAERGEAFRLPANHRSSAPVVDLANAFVREVVPALDVASADPDGTQVHGGKGSGEARVALAAVPSAKVRGGDLPAASPWIAALARESGWDAAGFSPLPGPRRRALLLPRRTGLPALRQALQRAQVEPLVQGREGFWESPGVRLMMALLEVAGRAEAEAPRLVLLRSPWIGATDAELAAFAQDDRAASDRVREGLAWMEGLRGLSTQTLVAAALARPGLLELVGATAVHGALEPARARRNLDQFLGWVPSLPPVPALAWAEVRRRRAAEDPGDAPAEDVAADLVVQTLHAAKGLEYDDVILPLMADAVKSVRKGSVRRRAGSPELWMGWKLGPARGPVLREVKAEEERRAFREGLNLLYVGLTRARDRMLLLQQWPEKEGVAQSPPGGRTRLAEKKGVQWHHVATDLVSVAADLRCMAGPAPRVAPPASPEATPLAPPPSCLPLALARPLEGSGSAERARRGIQVHALLREVLVRAGTDPVAARAYLGAHPLVRAWPDSGRMAADLLDALEARGWDQLPRRTEFGLAGAGKAGGAGRADLVLWRPDRRAPESLILVDFKLAASFPEEVLALHRQQLEGYRQALNAQHPGVPVEAWLLGLEGPAWVRVF